MSKATLVVVAVLLLLGGCGNAYDEEAHREAVSAVLGGNLPAGPEWDGIRKSAESTCDESESVFGNLVALHAEDGSLDLMRANVKAVCPDRLAEVEDAMEGINSVRLACGTPPAQRTEEQQMMAEAMGAVGDC